MIEEFKNKVQRSGLFDRSVPTTIARAPGRLDVMGGIADYSGSLVLQWPTAEATFAAVQGTNDSTIQIVSDGTPLRTYTLTLDEIAAGYAEARSALCGREDSR